MTRFIIYSCVIMQSVALQKPRRSQLAEAFLGDISQNKSRNPTQEAMTSAAAARVFSSEGHLGAPSLLMRASLPDIGAFYDRLAERGGITALNEEIRSVDCQRMLEQLASVDFEQASNSFLDKFVLTIEKMMYWREKLLIRGQSQRIFELFFRFCQKPQLYQKLSSDSLFKMISILGTAAKESCPPQWMDRILKDLNPELRKISNVSKQRNCWVPNAVIGMARIGCFSEQSVQMFNILNTKLVKIRPLNKSIKGFNTVRAELDDFIQSSKHTNTDEKQRFVEIVRQILHDWSLETLEENSGIEIPLPRSWRL